MPIPSAISIPFYIGTYIALDFCVGAAILLVWKLRAPESAAKFGIVTGAGLMVGDGLWQLPYGILGIAKVTQVCHMTPPKPVTLHASSAACRQDDPPSSVQCSISAVLMLPRPVAVTLTLAVSNLDESASRTPAIKSVFSVVAGPAVDPAGLCFAAHMHVLLQGRQHAELGQPAQCY